jgi:hypothetical protein
MFEEIALENERRRKDGEVWRRRAEEAEGKAKELERDLEEARGRLEETRVRLEEAEAEAPSTPERAPPESPASPVPESATETHPEPPGEDMSGTVAKIYSLSDSSWHPAYCVALVGSGGAYRFCVGGELVDLDPTDVSVKWDKGGEWGESVDLLRCPVKVTKHMKMHVATPEKPGAKRGGGVFGGAPKDVYFWWDGRGNVVTSKKLPGSRKGGGYEAADMKAYPLGAVRAVLVEQREGEEFLGDDVLDVVLEGERKTWFLSVSGKGGKSWAEQVRVLAGGEEWNNVVGRSP